MNCEQTLRANHPLKYLLPAAKMERSSFYFSRKHNQKPDKDLADMQTVRAVYDQHKGRYGARRIAALSWNKKSRTADEENEFKSHCPREAKILPAGHGRSVRKPAEPQLQRREAR